MRCAHPDKVRRAAPLAFIKRGLAKVQTRKKVWEGLFPPRDCKISQSTRRGLPVIPFD